MNLRAPTPSFPLPGQAPARHAASMELPISLHTRRWVPMLIWLMLAALAVGGSHGLIKAYTSGRPLSAYQVLAPLYTHLPGAQLDVPASKGLWALRQRGVTVVMNSASASGATQTVSLCDRAQPTADGSLQVYPMALVNTQADQASPWRGPFRPMVLTQDHQTTWPELRLDGTLPATSSTARLRLQLRAPSLAPAAVWTLALAPEASGKRPPGAWVHEMGQEAWLLWAPVSIEGSPDFAGGWQGQGFHQGLRLRRVAVAGCRWGGVAWQVFDATSHTTGSTPPDALAQAEAHAQKVTAVALAVQLAPEPPGEVTSAAHDAIASNPALWPSLWHWRLTPGTYTVPTQAEPPMEDRHLFDQALAAGWIQPLSDGAIGLAAADAAEDPVLNALYRSANGEFVRAQIKRANQDRYWLALRLFAPTQANLPVVADPVRWHLAAGAELLSWQPGLPSVAASLQDSLPQHSTDWVRILPPAVWTERPLRGLAAQAVPGPVRVSLPVLSSGSQSEPRRLRLLLLGQLLGVEGARVLADEAACHGPACGSPNTLRQVSLEINPGASALVLSLADQPAFNALRPAETEQQRLRWRVGQLVWTDAPSTQGHGTALAAVTLRARDGTVLYEQRHLTDTARHWGVAAWVGLGPMHARSLAGTLARWGDNTASTVDARTTLDPAYQASLQAVLSCHARPGHHWQTDNATCEEDKALAAANVPAGRIAAAVLLDAHSGEVLAAANGQDLPVGPSVDELLAFDAFNPVHSALQTPALHHTGGRTHTPGSTFKLLDAMMLEYLARNAPQATTRSSLDAQLQGQAPALLEARARAAGLAFDMNAACYPAPCTGRTTQVTNYKRIPAARYVEDGQFGLVQALRHSVNTWFAMLAEATDRTAHSHLVEARPLGAAALRPERPLLALTDLLGFDQPLRLDGGLLPADLTLSADSALLASASHFDPIDDVHNVRMQALGLRMQTTPLHMARVAAAIATGRVPGVHLLAELNGEPARALAGSPLPLRLDRIRFGMAEVVRAGTASGAFSNPALATVRHLVHGKTGTAPLADTATCRVAAEDPNAAMPCLNNAWFVGYLAPGALPGETRTLAFAVQISHTTQTGGSAAASVVSAWLAGRWQAVTHRGALGSLSTQAVVR